MEIIYLNLIFPNSVFSNRLTLENRTSHSPLDIKRYGFISMLLIPHAVLKGLVQWIVDVPHHTEYFTERVAPGITNEDAEIDRVVGEISGMIDLFSGQLFTAVVLAHNGIIMVKSIEGARGKKAKISSWNSRGRYIGVRLGRIRNVYRMTRTSWEWSRGSALDRGAWT